jgi:hypothetical protein
VESFIDSFVNGEAAMPVQHNDLECLQGVGDLFAISDAPDRNSFATIGIFKLGQIVALPAVQAVRNLRQGG